ncbi:MAG: Stp1/IreP family PP2C-type Ser/Thr phosphatase, partial [Actinomycetota bacterium]
MPLTVRETGACTDVGRLRQSNEDALVLADPVFAVADGMGGARAGEVASAMAVAALYGFAGGADGLVAALEDVNDRIHAAAQADGSLAGMGTTATAALVTRDELVIAHVGDSRAYLLRDGRLRQVTDDHSLVAELIRRGALTPAEAERHPQRSVITRALGAEPDVEVDVVRLVPQAGDVLLLCSDGLTGMVGDGEIGRIVGGQGPLPERARELVQAANGAGGEDNVTVVLVRIGERGEEDT